ncbi:U3-containing 90S pre-ribosomal complex subunit domain containing protein [Elaphomyces granulatus]|jgi:protein CMS1
MTEEVLSPSLSVKLTKVIKKRKRQTDRDQTSSKHEINKTATEGNESSGLSKKRREKDRDRDDSSEKAEDQEQKGDTDESISKMDGRLLADHFMQRARKLNKELTAVELNDLHIPEQAFRDTTSFRLRTLDNLPDFLRAYSPNKGNDLSKASEVKGTPHTLVVASAGLRAADLVRALRSFQTKEAIVAKLFAKHIKLDEAKKFVQRTRINIGVGTPQRLIDLIESKTLKVQELERIVIDGSYIDQKKRGIFGMKEMHFPLLQLLGCSEFRKRYGVKSQRLQVLVF